MYSSLESGSTAVPAFLNKLWTLVEDTSTNGLICWDPSGKSFHIYDQGHFAKEILPLYFKHSNIASFIRQLNMYGFRKVVNIEQGGLKTEKDDMEFTHPYFQQGQEQLLEYIKRKVNTSVKQDNPKVGNNELLKVLSDVRSMKGKQDTLTNNLTDLKRENAALWREVASLRQKHMKQQQIVNKLIQFLVTLVGNNRGLSAGLKRKLPLMINDAGQLKSSKVQPDFASQLTIEDALDDDFSEEDVPAPSGPTIKDITYTYDKINPAAFSDSQQQPQPQQQQQKQPPAGFGQVVMDGKVIHVSPQQLEKLAKGGILTVTTDSGPATITTTPQVQPVSSSLTTTPSATTSMQDKAPPSYSYLKKESMSTPPIIQLPKTPNPAQSQMSPPAVASTATTATSSDNIHMFTQGGASASSATPSASMMSSGGSFNNPTTSSGALAINDIASNAAITTDISDQLEVLQADLESVKDILISPNTVPGFDSNALFSLFGEELDLFGSMSSIPGDTNATADSSNFITGNELIQYQGDQENLFDLIGLQDTTDPVDPDALASYSANLDTPLLHIPDDEDPLTDAAQKILTTSTDEVD